MFYHLLVTAMVEDYHNYQVVHLAVELGQPQACKLYFLARLNLGRYTSGVSLVDGSLLYPAA